MLTKFTALAMGVLLSVSAMAADMATVDIATLTRQAQNGDAASQYELGAIYDYGYRVRRDVQKAVEWYAKAAHQGHAQAQHNLGVMYHKGTGVRQDYQKAVEWYTKAAHQGHTSSPI